VLRFCSLKSFLSNITTYFTRTWLRYVRVFAIANPSVCRQTVCLSSVCL